MHRPQGNNCLGTSIGRGQRLNLTGSDADFFSRTTGAILASRVLTAAIDPECPMFVDGGGVGFGHG